MREFKDNRPIRGEVQVTLSMPVDGADNLVEAVERFQAYAEGSPNLYVYTVQTNENSYHVDMADRVVRKVENT